MKRLVILALAAALLLSTAACGQPTEEPLLESQAAEVSSEPATEPTPEPALESSPEPESETAPFSVREPLPIEEWEEITIKNLTVRYPGNLESDFYDDAFMQELTITAVPKHCLILVSGEGPVVSTYASMIEDGSWEDLKDPLTKEYEEVEMGEFRADVSLGELDEDSIVITFTFIHESVMYSMEHYLFSDGENNYDLVMVSPITQTETDFDSGVFVDMFIDMQYAMELGS